LTLRAIIASGPLPFYDSGRKLCPADYFLKELACDLEKPVVLFLVAVALSSEAPFAEYALLGEGLAYLEKGMLTV